jgi:hypothetical protein
MKVKQYNEMMAYLTRPGFNSGGSVNFNGGGSVKIKLCYQKENLKQKLNEDKK